MKKTTKAIRPGAARPSASAARGKAATASGWRRCEAPGCESSFRPKSDRQIYCSPACKVRAFYWRYKENEGERYAARYERARQRPVRGGSRRAAGRRGAARPVRRRRATR